VTNAWLVHPAALGLIALDILVRAVRLRLLLGAPRAPRLIDAVAVNAYGDAASALTPGRLGGEPARFVGLKRYRVDTAPALVVLAAERVVDLSLVALVTVASLAFLGERGFRDIAALALRIVSPGFLPWVGVVVALVVLSGIAAWRLRHRFPPVVEHSLREALRETRRLSPAVLAGAAALTAVSMLARVAVLPVLLLAFVPLPHPVAALVGSFALIYSQLILPTPAGVGGVELGFVAGLAPMLPPADTAALLVAWRLYSLVIPAGLGGVLLLRDVAVRRSVRGGGG